MSCTPDRRALRARLASKEGPAYWRSLDEAAGTEVFQEALRREFPEGAEAWDDPEGRRRFLKIMGASLAFAGLSGCLSEPEQPIVPYVEQPEQVVPGKPLFFATAFERAGYAQGVLVESHMGRPTKIEGNPGHPASLGATDVFAQASILDLYDPDRSQTVLERGQVSTWQDATQALAAIRRRAQATNGEGLRLLTETVTSPTLGAQIEALLEQLPGARWHQHDPVARDGMRAGLRRATGRDADPVYRFDRADVVVALDADFLLAMPGSVRYGHDFARRRRVRAGAATMNRLYAVESNPTITGAMADHRLPLPPSRIWRLAQAAASRLSADGAGGSEAPPGLSEREQTFLDALVDDLQAHRGSGLVVAGLSAPAELHRLAHAMNEALGNVGRTVEYIPPVEAASTVQRESLRRLVDDIAAGEVEALVILGGNPVYTAPADVAFKAALDAVPLSVHLSPHVDETSARSIWHLPQTHFLETWSDARAFDGTATIMQPLIAPLYDGCHSAHEVVSVLMGGAAETSYDAVRAYWQDRHGGGAAAFERFWHGALYAGFVPGTGRLAGLPFGAVDGRSSMADRDSLRAGGALAADTLSTINNPPSTETDTPNTARALPPPPPAPDQETNGLELVFRPDPTLWDGRFANNGWLQELPKPITKLVWDNAAMLSPATALSYDLENEEVVELIYEGRRLEAPVWVVPGHADGCVSVFLGHGRGKAGRVGSGVGFSAYRLRTADRPWYGGGLRLRKTGKTYALATTQHEQTMEGRHLVKAAPLARFRENPEFVHEGEPIELPSLLPEYEYPDYKWGMVIDQNVCTGCNACIVACQSENNIPVVGKDEITRGRRMHWLRVDRYYEGPPENPATYFQPVPCMHCEKAPCELVCPVYATVHDEDGLNVMVYNRCIGTRYCSNNCPYKVRRFNFLLWQDWETESLKNRRNPDVTVRSRGVMEKCTYCTQRINYAKIEAKKEGRTVRDGEVLTACQQACPTQAIVFGDLNDESAKVKELEEQPHNYALLAELGTRPRTTYLAHLRNPNAALALEPESPGA